MSEWISVTDKLPIKTGNYLVSHGKTVFNLEGVSISSFATSGISPAWSVERMTTNKITHWMPLPKPPTE